MHSIKFLSYKKIITVFACCLLLGVVLLLYGIAGTQSVHPSNVKVTIFIHGTVASTLTFFGRDNLSGNTCDDNNAAAQFIKKFRNHAIMGYDQILGAEGLYEYQPHSDTSAVPMSLNYATQHLIPVYDDIAQISNGVTDTIQRYAVFGWSGLLHNAARKKAGYALYEALCDYRQRLIAHYGVEPEFTLVAHSHGGNVALYMACAELECKKNLRIRYLVMYGSPMMQEMAPCLTSNIFETIIMLYSKGDSIQGRDIFSSQYKQSHKRMADIMNTVSLCPTLGCKRYDICCSVKGDYKKITHTNMWLIGRSKSIMPCMRLVPLMVLTPAIISCVEQLTADHVQNELCTSAELRLADRNGMLQMRLVSNAFEPIVMPRQELLRERLAFWDGYMRDTWQKKDDCFRHPLFNRKNVQAFKNAWWG